MDQVEKTELIATRIMGWHPEQTTVGAWWCNETGMACGVLIPDSPSFFNPFLNDSQALDVAEKLRQGGWRVKITLYPNLRFDTGEPISARHRYSATAEATTLDLIRRLRLHTEITAIGDSLAEAISEAAYKVAEILEAKEKNDS